MTSLLTVVGMQGWSYSRLLMHTLDGSGICIRLTIRYADSNDFE